MHFRIFTLSSTLLITCCRYETTHHEVVPHQAWAARSWNFLSPEPWDVTSLFSIKFPSVIYPVTVAQNVPRPLRRGLNEDTPWVMEYLAYLKQAYIFTNIYCFSLSHKRSFIIDNNRKILKIIRIKFYSFS